MDQLNFSEFFNTKTEANDFVNTLAFLSQQVYQVNFNIEKLLTERIGTRKKDLFMTLLRNSLISLESPSGLQGFMDTLRERILSLPVISITIAFEPQEQTIQQLTEWFATQKNMQVLFDLHVDPGILGGATFSFNGKFADFSIKPTFQQIIQTMLQANSKK